MPNSLRYKIATMFPEHLPFECPPIFRMGRTPQSSLSVAEKDLWTYIRFHECTGSSLSVQEVEKAIVVMKMEKMGHLRDEPPVGELQSRIESMLPKYNHLWRDLKEWCRKTKPPSEQLSVSKLKLKTGYEVTSCTPQVVAAVLSDLEDMCTRAGIMRDGILLEKEAGRLIITDEKGFSARADAIVRGVTTRKGKQTAAASTPVLSFEHVTVTSFLPCVGPAFPCGVIVPFKRVHKNFTDIWPEAVFHASESGSQSPCLEMRLEEGFLGGRGLFIYIYIYMCSLCFVHCLCSGCPLSFSWSSA